MKRTFLSVTPIIPDNDQNQNDADITYLLIGSVVVIGFFSAVTELVVYLGWYIPHVLILMIGLFLGIAIGVLAARSFHPSNPSSNE